MAWSKRFSSNSGNGSSKQRQQHQSEDFSVLESLGEVSVPFRDAEPGTNEVPIDDLDTFVIPARDEKGISESTHLSLPPIMLRHIDTILRSLRFPYLRRSDFIRHGIYRHIRWCVSLRGSLPKHMLVSLEAIMEDCRDSEQRMRVEDVLKRIEDRVNFHIKHGDPGEALRLLSVMRTRVDGVHEDYWSRQVKDTLDEKFFRPLLSAGHPRQVSTEEVQ